MEDENKFEPRLGRTRKSKNRKVAKRGLQSLLIARIARGGGDVRRLGKPASARATARFNSRGRGATISLRRSSGWTIDPVSKMRVRSRRVMVKARVVKLSGAKTISAAGAHARYLQRDGVTREGEQGRFYSTFSDDADGKAFLERGKGDRHQFRFIVSPEDGPDFDTLRTFTRELMAKMEQDLGTTLDWVAVDHYDTGHPHTHVLLRGVTEDGKTLNIAGNYIAHGIRERASEIMTHRLGPQSELEVRQQLAREVDAERLTKLDRDILARAEEHVADFGQRAAWDGHGAYQQLLVARVRQLERMELAEREGPLAWRLAPELEATLDDLGRRGDIIRTIHRAMTEAKLDRRPELYVIDRADEGTGPVAGKVVHRGALGDHHDRRFLIVDGMDGRTHYAEIGASTEPAPISSLVRLDAARAELKAADRTIVEVARANGGVYDVELHLAHDRSASEAFARAHVRRLEALRRAGAGVVREADGSWRIPYDYTDKALAYEQAATRAAPVRVQLLAMLDLEQQAVLQAPTWLDGQLRVRPALEVTDHGYGREVRGALAQRQQWLISQGLAAVRGDQVEYRPDMEEVLRQREVRAAGARISRQLGLAFAEPTEGEEVYGILRRRVDMSSGSFALVENSREFSLVPWRPVLEKQLGQEIAGTMRSSGAIDWTIGRQRPGLEIGM